MSGAFPQPPIDFDPVGKRGSMNGAEQATCARSDLSRHTCDRVSGVGRETRWQYNTTVARPVPSRVEVFSSSDKSILLACVAGRVANLASS